MWQFISDQIMNHKKIIADNTFTSGKTLPVMKTTKNKNKKTFLPAITGKPETNIHVHVSKSK